MGQDGCRGQWRCDKLGARSAWPDYGIRCSGQSPGGQEHDGAGPYYVGGEEMAGREIGLDASGGWRSVHGG